MATMGRVRRKDRLHDGDAENDERLASILRIEWLVNDDCSETIG